MYGAELKEDCTSVCLWVLDREGPEGGEREGVDGYREAWMNGKKKTVEDLVRSGITTAGVLGRALWRIHSGCNDQRTKNTAPFRFNNGSTDRRDQVSLVT